MPDRTRLRSNVGTWRKNSSYSSRRAETHHVLHAGAVVPGPVEQDDLAGRGEVGDVALEVPLRALGVVRLGERGDPRLAGVQVLGEPSNRPALAGRVAAFEHDHDPLALLHHPLLQLHQLYLQVVQLALVLLLRDGLGVRAMLLQLHDRQLPAARGRRIRMRAHAPAILARSALPSPDRRRRWRRRGIQRPRASDSRVVANADQGVSRSKAKRCSTACTAAASRSATAMPARRTSSAWSGRA